MLTDHTNQSQSLCSAWRLHRAVHRTDRSLSGHRQLRLFCLSGMRKEGCFKTLHVTSTHYDEPRCLAMVRDAEVAFALHGCEGEEVFAHVGGGNENLVPKLIDYLNGLGYSVVPASSKLKGEDQNNFINRARQKGIQLELSAGFRRNLFPSFPRSIQRHPWNFRNLFEMRWGSSRARPPSSRYR